MRVPAISLVALPLIALPFAGADRSPAPAAPPVDASPPAGRPPTREGQPGRLLLGGRWLFRLDDREGWRSVSV